ncbi:triose-phosphate isomerase [Motiliproteus sediminis]|uniref:triose-phosphate isomerase n=1 Tax=Motiliproteus sediminis TaxID=1468178 RepID=UPI001AEFD14E|nr:triose-phosphate isomerase [Motiliproteus sediminis]
MRRPLVAGNWKMNGNSASIASLVQELNEGLSADLAAEVLVCPPHLYLSAVAAGKAERLCLGAQDVSEYAAGAYTGESSAVMLQDLGCAYVIVGHSERRALFGDTDLRVAAKFQAAQRAGLKPILCVGETLEQREEGATLAVIAAQIDAVLAEAGVSSFADAVVAYEPVWAIGTGRTATPEQAQEVHAAIRDQFARHDATVADGLQILYGGSVNAANAETLFAQADIDGGLVGGASLKADEFLAICRAAV